MADKTVRIVISAQDNFSTVLSKYQAALGQASAETENLNAASGQSTDGISNLTNVVKDAVVGFIAFRAVGMASELVQIGGKANVAQSAFNALSGGVSTAAANLQTMRNATGGIVSDLDLMGSANKLFQMGLAKTGDEAANLASTAIKLGQALGRDATESVADFSQMLAQGSIMRLDNFGLSSARVKERMAELADEFPNLDRQARFVKAAMEEAAKATDRLGDSVLAAQTPLAKLETSFDNLKTHAGQAMADIVNTAVNTGDQILKIADLINKNGIGAVVGAALSDPAQVAAGRRANQKSDAGVELFSEYLDMSGTDLGPMTGNQLQELLDKAFIQVEANPDLKNHWDQVVSNILGYPFDPNNPNMTGLRDSISATYDLITSESTILMGNQANDLKRFQAYAASQAGGGMTYAQMLAQNQDQAKYGAMTAYYGGSPTTGMKTQSWLSGILGSGDGMAKWQETLRASQEAQDKMSSFTSGTSGMGAFITPNQFDDIKSKFEELQQLNKDGLITDESLSKAKEFRDQAEAAAQAFQNMKLSDVFGQSNGGMQGQMTDDLIKRMKDSGNYTTDQLTALQTTLDKSSGRETDASLAYKDQVQPLIEDIYNQLGAAAAAQAMENLQTYMQQAKLRGDSEGTIAKNLPNATGFSYTGGAGNGQAFKVKPGDTASALAAQYGVPVSAILGAAGAQNAQSLQPGAYQLGAGVAALPNFNPLTFGQQPGIGEGAPDQVDPSKQMESMRDNSKDISTNMQDVSSQFDDINTKANELNNILDIAAGAREVKFTATLKDQTNGLLAILIGNSEIGTLNLSTGGVSIGTRDNGGRPPGVVPSSNQRGTIP